jgi:hypothetical protein
LFVKKFDAFWIDLQPPTSPALIVRLTSEGVRMDPNASPTRDRFETGEAPIRAETPAFALNFLRASIGILKTP